MQRQRRICCCCCYTSHGKRRAALRAGTARGGCCGRATPARSAAVTAALAPLPAGLGNSSGSLQCFSWGARCSGFIFPCALSLVPPEPLPTLWSCWRWDAHPVGEPQHQAAVLHQQRNVEVINSVKVQEIKFYYREWLSFMTPIKACSVFASGLLILPPPGPVNPMKGCCFQLGHCCLITKVLRCQFSWINNCFMDKTNQCIKHPL